ncbi:MAG: cysteine--tRNA ligase [Lautropia sp.]
MLSLHNTMTRAKERFVPLVQGRVGLYVCGITVYDYCHIGHARMLVAFDAIQRWLRASGYAVTYVRNITDIDDKIIRRAVERNEPISSVTATFIAAMHEDEAALGIQRPDHEPRATEYVRQMIDIVGRLRQNGLAYATPDGDMLFPVRRFPNYGRLSGKLLDEQRAGERVAVDPNKQDPADFVLWKAAKPEEPAEVKWPSPYGTGRPGWHLECSAMSMALLGAPFDIHGGGMDLIPTHHENEIAQSDGMLYPDGASSFVRYWLHNGFVNLREEKMSKSLGNFLTIRDCLATHDGEVLRFFLMRAHYRSPIDYGDTLVDDAREALLRLYNAIDRPDVADDAGPVDWQDPEAARFAAAMDDDFNTPVAIAVLFDLANRANRDDDPGARRLLRGLAAVLGLLGRAPAEVRRSGLRVVRRDDALDDARIDALIAERADAKKARRFADADRIRAELADRGVVLEDGPGGTTWRRG